MSLFSDSAAHSYFCATLDDVEQRKQEDPDKVHKVPVKTNVFNQNRIVDRQPVPLHQDHQKHEQADDHVNGMEPGHQEIV